MSLALPTGQEGDGLVSEVDAELQPAYGHWAWYSHFIVRNISQEAHRASRHSLHKANHL